MANADLSKMTRAVERLIHAHAIYMREVVAPPLLKFARALHGAMWDAYRAAGAPYGETEEGLRLWMAAVSTGVHETSRAERARDLRL